MCAVSAVYDYGWREPQDSWDLTKFQQYKELIRKAEEYDRLTKQPHCEDPTKAEWMKAIEERLSKLENK